MKLLNTVFYWRPRSDVFRVFTHLVDRIPKGGMTTGAVFSVWEQLSAEVRIRVALADCLAAVCRDGVSPAAVRSAIVQVEELRDVLSVDFPAPSQKSTTAVG